MRVSSSCADHDELRVLPPATDAVEMELRCPIGAFSILGMIRGYEIVERDDNRCVDRREYKNWQAEATERCIMIMVE